MATSFASSYGSRNFKIISQYWQEFCSLLLIKQVFLRTFFVSKDRRLWFAPIILAFGIGTYFSLPSEPSGLWSSALFAVLLSSWLILWGYRKRSLSFLYLFLINTFILLFSIGFSLSQFRTNGIHTPILEKSHGPAYIQGSVERIEKLSASKGNRVLLSVQTIEDLPPEQTPRKVRIHIRKLSETRIGDTVKVLAKLNPPAPPVAPGAFDFQRYAYFQSIGAVGFAYTAPEIVEAAKSYRLSVLYFFEAVQERIVNRIEGVSAGTEQSLLLALITGEKASIGKEDKKAMRNAGLAHLLAISGLHVGMVAGIVFFFVRFFMASIPNFALKVPIKKLAAIAAFGAALFYTLMVGAPIPTQRAMLMTGIALFAIMIDRSPFSLRLVAITAFCILLVAPESLLSVSFQMSFAAVIALVWFYDKYRGFWQKLHREMKGIRRIGLYFLGVMATTLVASLATAPFSLYHFQTFALYGILANLFAVPLVAFMVMPFSILGVALMPIGLEGLPLSIAGQGVAWIAEIAHDVSALKGAVLMTTSWPPLALGLIICAAFSALLFYQRATQYVLMSVCLASSMIMILLYKQPDIQISSGIDLFSVRGQNEQLYVSSGRKNSYTAENWLRRNGQSEDQDKDVFPKEGSRNFGLSCGELGCRWHVKGYNIAMSKTHYAQGEDCLWADILISQHPVQRHGCYAKRIIDFFDIWKNGSYAIWLDKDRDPRIVTDRDMRGQRPWTSY